MSNLIEVKIGYQGLPGSNSEEVAKIFSAKNNIENPVFIPLINSVPVIESLKKNKIDYAVVAVYNTLGGEVKETKEALSNVNLQEIDEITIQIHHCLFKHKNFKGSVKTIASHIQALKQTVNNRKRLFPHCDELEVEDTAIAAKYLAEGKLNTNIFVLCRKNAGEMYDLELVYENLEDSSNNFTTFKIFKL